jgi:DNA-binding LacI/PurR family transcriptional regulator
MRSLSKNTTIVDIAEELGVSPSTVSRALINHPDIRDETKEKVKKLAKKLRYHPNPIAQSLRSNQTKTIGVIVPEIKHDFFSSAISGIEEVAYQSGYTIILCQSNESFEREVVHTIMLMHHRVAGVLVSVAQNTKNGNHFQDLIKRRIPLVFFDRVCEDVKVSKVIIDDYKSALDAVSYLIKKGYKRIAHLAGPKELDICIKRRNGYLDALKRADMSPKDSFVRYGGMHEEDGYSSMDALLKDEIIPDAIFAVNDPVVIGAFQRIKEAGLRIPGDVALVGFSNNKITSLVDPPLTTVNQPSFEMGKRAAKVLVETINSYKINDVVKTIVLDTELVVRSST